MTPSAPPRASSGFRPPLQERSRRTLERVLTAGAEVFAEHGYEGLAIAEVCRRSGVSAGALYTRFESKEALARAIHDHVLERLSAEVAGLYAPSEAWGALPADEFVERAIRLLVGHFQEHAAIVRAIVLRAAVDPTMRARGTRAVGAMADAFTARLMDRAGDFAAAEPEPTIRSTFAMAFEATSWDVTFGSEFRAEGALGPDDLGERLVAMCRLMLLSGSLP
ncbi:TetR/AcrR family transcriptional regulator [Leucobacter weissii]|uniref:TetR/AcrR family transcriptional regulator n=1 Tax=Leucobacter weissii TaxID=1983706 RepID=A0A939MKK0_9MICO|nr:TetR/AcrR family transcriptional regulator [Leucobacter weissii]